MYTGQERRNLQAAARRADDKKWADRRLEAENERLREQVKQIGVAFDALNNHFKANPPGDVVGDLLLEMNAMVKLFPAVGWDGDLRADVARLTAERDAAKADAQRYRHLRNQPSYGNHTPHGSVWVVRYSHPLGTLPELKSAGFGAELDASVDAALASIKQEGRA